MGRKPFLDEQQWEELLEFYRAGHTYLECGVRFGVSAATVQRYFSKHPEIPRRKPMQKARPEKADSPELVFGKVRVEDSTPPPGPTPKPRTIVSLKGEWNGN
jgi:transposase